MEPNELPRAPMIRGLNLEGESLSVEYAANLMNVVLFFDPVSRVSQESVEAIQAFAGQYEKLSVNFWFIMEPRLSCMHVEGNTRAMLTRLGLPSNVLIDYNDMIGIQAGIRSLPAVLVVDSNSFLKLKCEGEIRLREIERTVQARLAMSGYRVDLPYLGAGSFDLHHSYSSSGLKQLGYATSDYDFCRMIIPEADQQFSLPGVCLSNSVYPHGEWFVGRDYIEGKAGSTIYVSCDKDESVYLFAGSDNGSNLRMHTPIEVPHRLVLGRDVRSVEGVTSIHVSEFRPYEVFSSTGDGDIVVSLQVTDAPIKMYSVELAPLNQLVAINR